MNLRPEENPSQNEIPYIVNDKLNSSASEQADHFRHMAQGLRAISTSHVDRKLTDSVHSNQGAFFDLPDTKISDLMKLNSLQNEPTRSLFNIMNNILEEGIEREDRDIPQRVASLLKIIVQEIDRRASKQAENLKKQSLLHKSREHRYQSRIKALETLSVGTAEENEVLLNQLKQIKIEKARIEEWRKREKKELSRLVKEKEDYEIQISSQKKELEVTIKTHEENCLQLKTQNEETKVELERKIMELESFLADSEKRVRELEVFSESKYEGWKKKELRYKHFIDSHVGSIQDLRKDSKCLKQEVLKTKQFYTEELNNFELEVKGLVDAAQNYHTVLLENRKLYNEVQDLKGNIRVYCRVRPFHPDQSKNQSTIEYIGENGELVVANPLKQGKDTHRVFKFNKVFDSSATQEDVFRDTSQLIRSVLDGYNVCIFAYGQTGSGKTYTMTGPSLSSTEEWGVNYRALNDLFNISQSRKSSIEYEIGVQMVEIYNEQVRDLLRNESSRKKSFQHVLSSLICSLEGVTNSTIAPSQARLTLEFLRVGLLKRRYVLVIQVFNEIYQSFNTLLPQGSGYYKLHDLYILLFECHAYEYAFIANAFYIVYLDLHTLGILNTTQPNGLAVPDASMHEVKSTADVLELMSIGLLNRAVGATALNERSSRSHSVLTVHVKGTDLETKALLHGCLHLVDLAGSERVDRSEATGDRLREAQHINKSLSALGDVISALAQKNAHVPYRNSKLTQLLQSSLGGQAKTLMFVQLNPDIESHSETLSTLKFAERVSGVELGAARSNREGRGVKELMEQVAFLQDTISKKDEEIGQLRKHQTNSSREKRSLISSQSGSASAQRTSGDGCRGISEEFESWSIVAEEGVNINEEVDLLGSGESDSAEKLSDMSDGVMSMGTEADGSSSIFEYSLLPETTKPPPESADTRSVPAKLPRPPHKHVQNGFSRLSLNNVSSKVSSSKQLKGGSSSAVKSSKQWQ